MIEEKVNTQAKVTVEIAMLGTTQAVWLSVHKTPFRFAILCGGKGFACRVKNNNALQFGRLVIPCHAVEHDREGVHNRLVITVSAFDAGRMVSYAASRKWDWRGGTDALHAEFRAENGHRLGEALKAILA